MMIFHQPILCGVCDSGDHPPSPLPTDSTTKVSKSNKVSFYRCKIKHRKLFERMKKALTRYATPERMSECLHGFRTQMNKCVNNLISYYAPKNKTYGTTMALNNRISIVTGIHNLGYHEYWTRSFDSLELSIPLHLCNNLTRRDKKKSTKRKYNEKKETKKKRMKVTYDKMQTMIKQQILDEKRGATYQRGMAIEDSYPSEVVRLEKELQENGQVKCEEYGCHRLDHKTKSSKRCMYYTLNKKGDLYEAQDARLRKLYPTHYGGLISICSSFVEQFLFFLCKI